MICIAAVFLGVWGNLALKADFVTLDKQKVKWSSMQGEWIVVNYFAEWCVPCLREIPELNAFYHNNHQSINMFGVSFDKMTRTELAQIKNKYDIQFPLIDQLDSYPWLQPPTSLPTTYIIGADGQVKKQLKGEQSSESLLRTIHTLQAF